jgi:hypothetical protein
MRETSVFHGDENSCCDFWVLAPRSLVGLYKLFVGVYCLHLHRSLVLTDLTRRCRVPHDYGVNFVFLLLLGNIKKNSDVQSE